MYDQLQNFESEDKLNINNKNDKQTDQIEKIHCVKSVQIRSVFWSVLSLVRTK